ncbi:HlyD family secretion protein [Anatilimnocola aggregata]|uniref:HlyD family secretion protein n=1 Tax=Anatilimnocola aggregata TaxID=2528021 RepID=A0A517YE07_9BACT|nr:HlyD family efflux transporter periplasmic adaptor subunit [Anatilimnocola aggregata]QDU28468.1 HlyD family secretion protein [Anatilimnocola aggregata]
MASTYIAPKEGASDGWQKVDAALDRLHQQALSETIADRFYTAVLNELRGLQLPRAAIWKVVEGRLRLVRRVESPGNSAAGVQGEVAQEQAAAADAIDAKQPRVARPAADSAVTETAKPASCAAAPWFIANRPAGALVVWLEPDSPPAAVAGQLRLLSAIAELMASFQAQSEWHEAQTQLQVQARLAPLLVSLHSSLKLAEIAQRIASDGRAAVGCDRIAVAIRRGRGYRTLAVSGADHLHRHSQTIRQLDALCTAVAVNGDPLWWEASSSATDDETLPPQVQHRLAEHLDVSPAVALAVIPLRSIKTSESSAAEANSSDSTTDAEPLIATLVFECYSRTFDEASQAVIAGMLPHCAGALTHGLLVQRIPGQWLWLRIARQSAWHTAAFRWAAALVVLALAIAALFLLKADVQVRATGEIQSEARREIFAPWDGVATEVHVDHGQRVKAGDLLLTIHSAELEQQLQEAQGEADTARKQLAAVQSQRLQAGPGDVQSRNREATLTAEEQQLQAQLTSLADKLKMLARRREELTVRSPINGEVVTWNARERLVGRPLRRGDQLLTVADPAGPWKVELRIPSRSAGRVLASAGSNSGGQAVTWTLTSQPGNAQQGVVRSIAQRIELDEAGRSHLRLTVEPLAKTPAELGNITPGSLVSAKVACGRSTLAEAWFHDLIDTIRLWLTL